MPNLAAVPGALGNVSFGLEYLISPGRSRFSATLALAHDGPNVGACRVLLPIRIEGGTGYTAATHGELCGNLHAKHFGIETYSMQGRLGNPSEQIRRGTPSCVRKHVARARH